MEENRNLNTKPRLPVVLVPDPLKHFDGDHWAVRLCALIVVKLQTPVLAFALYLTHAWLK